MAKTRANLIYQTLYNLGVLPPGQTPGSDEYNAVADLVDPLVEELIARDIVFIEDVDAVDEKYFMALAHMLAGSSASVFGMQNDPALAARAQRGEQDLNEMNRKSLRYDHVRTMRSDYPVLSAVDVSTLFST
jgi:hypothetical protein